MSTVEKSASTQQGGRGTRLFLDPSHPAIVGALPECDTEVHRGTNPLHCCTGNQQIMSAKEKKKSRKKTREPRGSSVTVWNFPSIMFRADKRARVTFSVYAALFIHGCQLTALKMQIGIEEYQRSVNLKKKSWRRLTHCLLCAVTQTLTFESVNHPALNKPQDHGFYQSGVERQGVDLLCLSIREAALDLGRQIWPVPSSLLRGGPADGWALISGRQTCHRKHLPTTFTETSTSPETCW